MNVTVWKKIHNYFGLASSLFLAVLLVTGILLNHPESIEKDKQGIVAMDPANADRIYRAKKDALYVSNDRGVTWEEIDILFPPRDVSDIAFSPGKPRKIYLLEKWGKIYYSEDDKIWNNIGLPFDPQTEGIALEKLSAGDGGKLLLHTSNGWLASSDGGRSWDESSFDRKALPLHRLILTLHNGYFFGPRFVWLYDFAAIALLILIATGFILWKTGKKIA